MAGKRKLIGAERLGNKTLQLVTGMAVAVGIAVASPVEASTPSEPVVTASISQVAPGTIVLVPAASNGEQITYHRSHSSHQSHQSHSSHYSGR
jgi:hypothetical protein